MKEGRGAYRVQWRSLRKIDREVDGRIILK
jgi:hypothetical protein